MRKASSETTPIAVLVARYLRWLRNEWGATEPTMRDYTGTLQPHDRGRSEIASWSRSRPTTCAMCIDLWAAKSPSTRCKVTSVVRSCWAWAEDEGHVDALTGRSTQAARRSLAASRPCCQATRTSAYSWRPSGLTTAWRWSYCSTSGYVRASWRACSVETSTRQRRTLTVFGKGQKERVLPLRGSVLAELDAYLAHARWSCSTV